MDNTLNILIARLENEIKTLASDTNAQILMQKGAVAELCTYIKENLSNTLRCLFDDMRSSGELTEIINEIVLTEVRALGTRMMFNITPDAMSGSTDAEKVQSAINNAVAIINAGGRCTIDLNRLYDVTGRTIEINKTGNREKLVFSGVGGFVKNDNGFMFTTSGSAGDIEFNGVCFKSRFDAKLLPAPAFINVSFYNCKMDGIGAIVESDTYLQNVRVDHCLITGGTGDLFKCAGFYGLYVNHCTIEHRSGYVVNQLDLENSVTIYNRCYFIDICDNLIEGFLHGGIAKLYRVGKVNISRNYFENMCENIIYKGSMDWGSLSVCDNRLYIGSAQIEQYGQRGLLNLMTSVYPAITIDGNNVENCFLFYIANEYSSSKVINARGNTVSNTNTRLDFTENFGTNNVMTNKAPFIENTIDNEYGIYSRAIVLVSDRRFEVVNSTHNWTLSLENGVMKSDILQQNVTIPGEMVQKIDVYAGIPIYIDDVVSNQFFGNTENVSIVGVNRSGAGNSKHLVISVKNTKRGNLEKITLKTSVIKGSNKNG